MLSVPGFEEDVGMIGIHYRCVGVGGGGGGMIGVRYRCV